MKRKQYVLLANLSRRDGGRCAMGCKILLISCAAMLVMIFIAHADSVNVDLIGHYPFGVAYDVHTRDNYAYLCAEESLIILDVSNPIKPIEIARIAIARGTASVYAANSYAYVVDWNTLRIIDVSDHSRPYEVGRCEIHGGGDVFIRVVANYAYIPGSIVDISDPSKPHQVGSYSTGGTANGFCVANDYAYVSASTSHLRVVDISNPMTPRAVGHYSAISDRINGLYVIGDYVYMGTNRGLRVMDVSDPTNPHQIGAFDVPHEVWALHVTGDYAYMATKRGLYVIDVSAPMSPQQVSIYDTKVSPNYFGRIYVAGGYAYMIDMEGLRVIDISVPENPHEAAFYAVPILATGVHVADNYAYVANGSEGLCVIDVSDPNQLRTVGFCDTQDYVGNYTYGVCANGEYAYIGDGEGLHMIDISNPLNPHKVGFVPCTSAVKDIYVTGDHAYLAASTSGLRVIDISAPETVTEVGSCKTMDSTLGVYVAGDYAYVACGWEGLYIVDISNPRDPKVSGSEYTPCAAFGVYVVDNYAYVAGAGLCIIDISNPISPYHIASYDTIESSAGVGGIYVSDNYAYLAGSDGLCVMDISNPTNAYEVGFYDTASKTYQDGAEDIHIANGYVYLATKGGGLYILQYNPLAGPYPIPADIAGDKCNPKNGATNVDPSKYDELTIVFTEPMNEVRKIATEPGFNFEMQMSKDGTTLTVEFIGYKLEDETEYRISLLLIDRNGETARLEYSFKTGITPITPEVIFFPEEGLRKVSVFIQWVDWDSDPYWDGIAGSSTFMCSEGGEVELWIDPTDPSAIRPGKRLVYKQSVVSMPWYIPQEEIKVNPFVDSTQQGVLRIWQRCDTEEYGWVGMAYVDLWSDEETWSRFDHNIGNVDWDNEIGMKDLTAILSAFGSIHTEDSYDGRCDFNNDAVVNILDLIILCANYPTSNIHWPEESRPINKDEPLAVLAGLCGDIESLDPNRITSIQSYFSKNYIAANDQTTLFGAMNGLIPADYQEVPDTISGLIARFDTLEYKFTDPVVTLDEDAASVLMRLEIYALTNPEPLDPPKRWTMIFDGRIDLRRESGDWKITYWQLITLQEMSEF